MKCRHWRRPENMRASVRSEIFPRLERTVRPCAPIDGHQFAIDLAGVGGALTRKTGLVHSLGRAHRAQPARPCFCDEPLQLCGEDRSRWENMRWFDPVPIAEPGLFPAFSPFPELVQMLAHNKTAQFLNFYRFLPALREMKCENNSRLIGRRNYCASDLGRHRMCKPVEEDWPSSGLSANRPFAC